MEAIGDNMTTDLRFEEMTSFINYAVAGTSLNAETLNLAGGDSMIDGIYYYQLDELALAETKTTLQKHLGLLPDSELATETDESTTEVSDTTAPSY